MPHAMFASVSELTPIPVGRKTTGSLNRHLRPLPSVSTFQELSYKYGGPNSPPPFPNQMPLEYARFKAAGVGCLMIGTE